MSRLPHLSSDVFTELAHILLGNDLQRLLFCGSRALNAKLYPAIDAFAVETSRFSTFPFSAFQMPKLRSLHVQMAKTYEFYPIGLNGRSMLPTQPLYTLLELKLSCAQSFSVCGDGVTQPQLKELLPQLRVLHLSGTSEMVQGRMFQSLPETLQHLAFLSGAHTAAVISYLALLLLPRDLESLELPTMVSITDSPDRDGYERMVWPVGMKRLNVNFFAQGTILYNLPSRLEYLNLSWQSREPRRIPLSRLPRNLKELILYNSYSYLVIVDVPLPSKLKVLEVHEIGYPTEQEQYEACEDPPTLPFPSLDLLPSSLTSIRPLHKFVPSTGMQRPLPSSLRSVALSMTTIWMVPLLPPTLVSLSLPTAGIGQIPLESLPKTLELLSIGLSGGEAFAHLPRSLKSLHSSFMSAVGVRRADFQGLPPLLEEMSFSVDSLIEEDAFLALPKTLKTLRLTATKISKKFKELGTSLPNSLTDLRLSVSDLNEEWPLWIMQLVESRVALVNLDIFPSSSDRSTPAFDHSFMENLPPSLLSLRVSAPLNWVSAKTCLHKLPNLHTLYVMPISTVAPVGLPDAHFSNLPPSLTYLRVPSFKALTPKFWQVLPPGILFVSYGHGNPPPDFNSAKNSYYGQPRWQSMFKKPAPTYETYEEEDGPM